MSFPLFQALKKGDQNCQYMNQRGVGLNGIYMNDLE